MGDLRDLGTEAQGTAPHAGTSCTSKNNIETLPMGKLGEQQSRHEPVPR